MKRMGAFFKKMTHPDKYTFMDPRLFDKIEQVLIWYIKPIKENNAASLAKNSKSIFECRIKKI